MEEFRKVNWYNDCYYVSNFGRVKSFVRNKSGKILKEYKDSNGYVQVLLADNNRRKKVMVHRLVAECFLDGYQEGLQINHKDGNRSNNKAENLEWVTPSKNMHHSYAVLGRTPPSLGKFGETAPYHRPILQYNKQMQFVKRWGSIIEAARFYNYRSTDIWKCLNGMTKSSHGFIWKYEED